MSKKEYKGTVSIHGKEYSVEVINGTPYIEGKTTEEFLATAPMDVVRDFTKLGIRVAVGKPPEDIQTAMDVLYIDGSKSTILDADELD